MDIVKEKNKISVCMATYNGEKYIHQQLESIRRQTTLPDEVIICDDGSTDRTVEIIKEYIEKEHLEDTWKVFVNAEKKGYPGNFYYAMSLVHGEIVFLADQDDLWEKNKIEELSQVLLENKGCKLVTCNWGIINDVDECIKTIMNPSHNGDTGKQNRIHLEDIFWSYRWPGMVMAYRNAWYQQKMKSYVEGKGTTVQKIKHDILLAVWAAEMGGMFELDRRLAYHRRHEANAALEEHRVKKLLKKTRKIMEVQNYLEMLRLFLDNAEAFFPETTLFLTEKYRVMTERLDALQNGNKWTVLKNAWKDRNYIRVSTWICDFLIVGQKE